MLNTQQLADLQEELVCGIVLTSDSTYRICLFIIIIFAVTKISFHLFCLADNTFFASKHKFNCGMCRRQVTMTNRALCVSEFIRSSEKQLSLPDSLLVSLWQYSLQEHIDMYTSYMVFVYLEVDSSCWSVGHLCKYDTVLLQSVYYTYMLLKYSWYFGSKTVISVNTSFSTIF